jgi:ubiquinol-cytochrome c reductase cytochrome c subunit
VVVAAGLGSMTHARAAAPVDARMLFQRDCAVCHGPGGTGTKLGPSLIGVGRAAIDYYVTTGRMPLGRPGRFALDADAKVSRHTPPYTAAEMRALVDYAVSVTGPGGPDLGSLDVAGADLGRGGELFRLQCAACHSWAGEGGALLHGEAPELTKATARQTAEAVRVGPGAMPAFGTAALDDQQLADVVAYVRQLQHPHDPGGSALWHLGPVAEGAVALVIGLGVLLVFTRWIGDTA